MVQSKINIFIRVFVIFSGTRLSSFAAFFEGDVSSPRTSAIVPRILDWGDYAEYPDSCPALTTCPVICVTDETECPTSCPGGFSLCADGTCEIECDQNLTSPCECEGLNITCAKVIDFYDACKTKYAFEYNETAICYELQDATEKLSFTGPWFLFVYSWLSGVTVLVVLWCAYNQRIHPLPGGVQPLEPILDTNVGEWSQTGYKKHWLGTIICYCVWLTLWGIQFLLFLLTIFYYMQQEAIARWPPVFQDEGQVLSAFELVWFIGFFWTLAFQWPHSVESLFLRRCWINQATHIAVDAPTKLVDVIASSSHVSYGLLVVKIIWYPIEVFLCTILSYPHTKENYQTAFCKVVLSDDGRKSFYFRMGRYVYNEDTESYVPGVVELGQTIGDYIDRSSGLSTEKVTENYSVAGSNVILLEKPTVLGTILKEFSKTFYVYQNFMVWTWFPYWYYYMALIHTFVRLTAGLVVSYFQFVGDSVLYKLSIVEGEIEVIRDGVPSTISVKDVVPGDVVVLRPGPCYCDMVVLESDHVLVDEAALTGESNPIAKTELDGAMTRETYNETRHKVHTIYAGTEIIEIGDSGAGRALVIATGSSTVKGKLLTDILSFQRHKFLFDDEVKVVLLLLFVQAVFYITLVFQWLGDQFVFAFFYAAFILAAIIPPLLPTVFVVSVGISANRLREKRITCTNPDGILVAGKVNVCCFDKTGTLTKPRMEFLETNCSNNKELEELCDVGMAVCHSLKKATASGELVGNSVDRASFKSSGGNLRFEIGNDVIIEHKGSSYTILKHFDFDNHRQTQSVVVRYENGSTHIFVKGSPEAIRALSNNESIPNTFEETLRTGSKAGLYQLAIAHKEYDLDMDVNLIQRNDLEKSLNFCGFLVFKNPMKEETPNVMAKLADGNILMTMVTGDNIRTGVAVARESGICKNQTLILGEIGDDKLIEWMDFDRGIVVQIPFELSRDVDLAITGDAFEILLQSEPQFAHNIAKHVRVFGRCNPTHKVSVINALVRLKYITLMCGDGQNDCGALKSAHVGIALSSSDASIVAPFTSLDLTVTSVVEVLLEGRCALSSALKAYSYYILYGQVEACLQTVTAYLFVTFSDWCWFFLDGVWPITLAFSLPLAHAASKLSPCRPTASLLGLRTLFSVCGILALNYFFIIMSLVALNHQDWYQCRRWNSEDVSSINSIGDNYETSVLFVVGGYQYIISAVALHFGYTFRAPYYKNYVFVVLTTLYTTLQFVMTLYPSSFSCIWRVNCDNSNALGIITSGGYMPINNPFNTTVMPEKFRWTLIGIMLANLVSLCLWEYYFVNGYLYKTCKFGKDDPLSETTTNGYTTSKEADVNEKPIDTSEVVVSDDSVTKIQS